MLDPAAASDLVARRLVDDRDGSGREFIRRSAVRALQLADSPEDVSALLLEKGKRFRVMAGRLNAVALWKGGLYVELDVKTLGSAAEQVTAGRYSEREGFASVPATVGVHLPFADVGSLEDVIWPAHERFLRHAVQSGANPHRGKHDPALLLALTGGGADEDQSTASVAAKPPARRRSVLNRKAGTPPSPSQPKARQGVRPKPAETTSTPVPAPKPAPSRRSVLGRSRAMQASNDHGGVKIVSWNMNHVFRKGGSASAWQYLREMQPAVALLQECGPPPEPWPGTLVYHDSEPVEDKPWGTAIWCPQLPLTELTHADTRPGVAVAGEVTLPDGSSLTAISLYARLEYLQVPAKTGYSITTIHRALSDLTSILEHRAHRTRVVLAGDFNANVIFDQRQRSPTHRLMFERVEAFGLQCLHDWRDPAQQLTTWTRPNAKVKMLDYAFVTAALSSRAHLTVIDNDDVRGLSDHLPLRIDLA